MKKLILQAIVCCAALLPVSQLNAAQAAKTYGGFAVGQKIKMKVTERTIAKVVGFGKPKIVKVVPSGAPDFKEGSFVTFVIGSKGQLTQKDKKGKLTMSLPFKEDAITANVYATLPTRTNPRANIGQVYKDSTGAPMSISLSFFKTTISGTTPTTTTTVYILE